MPLDPAAAQLLSMLQELQVPPFETMTPAQCRELTASLRDPNATGPDVAEVRDTQLAGVPVRIYRPTGQAPFGVLVWFHGGGWVIGSIDESDVTARQLAHGAGVVVVSVGYRLAPEHRFPAAVEDAEAVTRYVLDHAADLDADPARVAVGGDSAGGNLAAVVAQALRDRLAFQLLVYPVTDATMASASYAENAEGYLLTKPAMAWFFGHYLEGTGTDLRDPRLSPLFADDLSGLAPALVITAEFDPLRDEGEAYARQLEAAGVPVTLTRSDGMIHGFFTLTSMIPTAQAAVDEATAALRSAISESVSAA